MQTPLGFARLSRKSLAIVGLGVGLMLSLFYLNRASAGTGLSVTPNFPTPVTVGQTGVATSLVVANASTADEGNVTVSNITLIPSCGNSSLTCTAPDPDVFAVSASGTGRAGTSCAGDTFTIAEIDAATGKVSFTRNGGPLVLAFNASCTIDFTVDVLKSPTLDSSGAAGIQTNQRGSADGLSALQNPADGTGADTTTVNKVSPGIQTTPSAGGPIGTVLNDTATLSGGINPTGSITFKLFSPSDATCAGTASYTEVEPVSGNGAYSTSPGFASNAAGVWRWTASYSGDASNNAVASGCQDEQVTIAKLSSTTVTELHDAAEAAHANGFVFPSGSTVHDKATVSGSGPTPTGNVTFTFFSGAGASACDAQSVTSGVVALNGSGVAHPSTAQGPLLAGSYAFRASYEGDANYNSSVSGCEPFSVELADSSVTTHIHNASHTDITGQSVSAGTVVHDQATVNGSGGGPTPTGTVDFKRFANSNCTGDSVDQNNVALVGGVAESSTFVTVTGSLGYLVHYDGDANYDPSDGVCEPLTVNKLNSSVVTQVHNDQHQDITNTSVPVGTNVHDQATVSGSGPTPTGTVDFKRFSTNNCSGASVDQNDVALVNGVAESSTVATSGSGLSYMVHYDGDAVYNSSDGSCEPLTITNVQGCSPGYWKQPQHFGSYPDGVFPNDLFTSVGFENAFPGKTLLQVLSQGGGGLNALGRIIVGAYLNAATIDGFPFTPQQVVDDFNAVFPGGDYNALKAKYEALQDPCPLGNNPGPAGRTTAPTTTSAPTSSSVTTAENTQAVVVTDQPQNSDTQIVVTDQPTTEPTAEPKSNNGKALGKTK